MIIRVLGEAVSVTAANTVNDANLVRVHATNAATITIVDASETTIGSFNMTANAVEIVEKEHTDTIEATAAVSCTPIAFR